MRHVQAGRWLITWHSAFCPHVPGHGSWHLFLVQALFEEQSEFRIHSGRQPSYGFPKYSGKHWHDPMPFCSRQIAFDPQGFGSHGDRISSTGVCCTEHAVNGSPLYPTEQMHIGIWLNTRHSALAPHKPGHGSLHLLRMHAKWLEHSELLAHSGRQLGGVPINSAKQEHEGVSLISLHSEFGPHGDGWQGFMGACWGGCSTTKQHCLYISFLEIEQNFVYLLIGWHRLNGSPVYLGRHTQFGWWLITEHFAFTPHVPGQGSLHVCTKQASFCAHSEFCVHSGRHDGGLPIYPLTHEHTACSLITLHWLFGPQGDGLHGFTFIGSLDKKN